MYLLYSMVLVVWGMLLIPVFLYKAWRHHKYLPGVSQRLGRLPRSLRSDGRPTLWFHACSVGETLSLEPLVHTLQERFPRARFVFSTITQTGQLVATQHFTAYGAGNVFYFPVDLAPIVRRVFDWIRPAMIVIVDTEIWPNTVHQAHLRGIPVVLANGRISAASFRYYRAARFVLGRVLRQYAVLMMQSGDDALRIERMGAPPDKILITGNLKFDHDPVRKDAGESIAQDLAERFGLRNQADPLIVAGSTHPGEEQVLLEVLRRLRGLPETERTRLLLAPRHPERFDETARLAEQGGFRVRRRTGGPGSGEDAQVLLLDTIGELAAAYRFATIVFIGGTLVRRGGHSILEPALYSKPIVIGPSMENFRHILEEFRLHNGIIQIQAEEEDKELQVQQMMDVLVRLLQNIKEREDLGRAAFSILERNRGAARRTADKIDALFAKAPVQESAPASLL